MRAFGAYVYENIVEIRCRQQRIQRDNDDNRFRTCGNGTFVELFKIQKAELGILFFRGRSVCRVYGFLITYKTVAVTRAK